MGGKNPLYFLFDAQHTGLHRVQLIQEIAQTQTTGLHQNPIGAHGFGVATDLEACLYELSTTIAMKSENFQYVIGVGLVVGSCTWGEGRAVAAAGGGMDRINGDPLVSEE